MGKIKRGIAASVAFGAAAAMLPTANALHEARHRGPAVFAESDQTHNMQDLARSIFALCTVARQAHPERGFVKCSVPLADGGVFKGSVVFRNPSWGSAEPIFVTTAVQGSTTTPNQAIGFLQHEDGQAWDASESAAGYPGGVNIDNQASMNVVNAAGRKLYGDGEDTVARAEWNYAHDDAVVQIMAAQAALGQAAGSVPVPGFLSGLDASSCGQPSVCS